MAPYRSPRRHTRHPHFEQPLLTGSNSQTLVGPPQTLEIQQEGHLHHPFLVNLEVMSLSVTKEQIVRETARRGRLPSMSGGHRDGTRQASCDQEADREGGGEGRRSRLPLMSGGRGDGQASTAWSSRSLQTSSGHGAIC
ncbi:unnamed protein product [Miscanthus lutarioriparius]|uniref:Uncharacterized protein n=1 Tax=Miscanthus lutarioriparius TaxID=422564 RepID=A0A811RHZ7_9POAL|nr:unnamed protein product [Miscanthus lutarioriparius]